MSYLYRGDFSRDKTIDRLENIKFDAIFILEGRVLERLVLKTQSMT